MRLGVVQMACGQELAGNLDTAERLVRKAAAAGADLVLLPELFAGPYFCKDKSQQHFALAQPAGDSRILQRMGALAAELGVVLPVSFFERAAAGAPDATPRFFNSMAMFDGGELLGVYRKAHIPDGPGYWEKFYFTPGDGDFKVWQTRAGRIGVGICWDQWFPEAARSMCLQGAELLLYPTAIGSEPEEPDLHTRPHWQRVMQGHAGANLTYLAAANRVGLEQGGSCAITFYGASFIAGPDGDFIEHAAESGEALLLADLDLDAVHELRRSWGLFRDRRPELYHPLVNKEIKVVPGK